MLRRRIDFERLDEEDYVVGAYHYLLGMKPDDGGLRNYTEHLRRGTLTRPAMLAEMRGIDDWWLQRILDPHISLHLSRKLWVQQLPKAARIVDLGGTDQSHDHGALVSLGYPYPFELLTIVDLPPEDRHEIYGATYDRARVETALGTVEYVHRSMTDLSFVPDASVDLVFSGQSIEHVSAEDGDVAFREAMRVLRPGGYLCLDTPNRAATRLQVGDTVLSNPDHELEYTHAELTVKIEAAGFEIEVARGLNLLPEAFATGVFSDEEMARHLGVFADIERCYVLGLRVPQAVSVDLNRYSFRSDWHVPAPVERVYGTLEDLTTYPSWWREVRRAECVRIDAFQLTCRATLPYDLVFTTTQSRRDPDAGVLEASMTGDLEGFSRWTLTPTAAGTLAVFEEEVEATKRLLRVLAPVARPAFRFNHWLMMKHGQSGLRAYLQQ